MRAAPQVTPGERLIDDSRCWLVLRDHRDMAILLLTQVALYVCVVEDLGSLGDPFVYAIPFVDSNRSLMGDDGSMIIEGVSRVTGLHGSSVLDLIPGPLAWQFAIRSRETWEAQSGRQATGHWRERPWSRDERKRWEQARGGYS